MPSNPFKRLQSLKGPSSPRHTGITIAADTSASGSTSNGNTSRSGPSTSLALPPDSEYRTSLIMPHLTRRFTLLRAPDGTMVTPDAMRAHLRAQRARARAAGLSGNQTFLTEEEENEIIDQLRRQTKMEMQDEEEYTQSQSTDQFGEGSDGFGGTDGFGGWGSSDGYASTQNTSSRIDSRLADSLSSLKHNSGASNSQDPISGSFFSGRSSARDQAYITEVEKGRAARGREDANTRELEQVQEEEDDLECEEAMPGDFLVATKRASKQTSDDAKTSSRDSDNNLKLPKATPYRHSQLLTTLSPESFKRVSTALEEVYGIVAGKVEEEGNPSGITRLGEQGGVETDIVQNDRLYRQPSFESDAHSFASAHSEVVTNSNNFAPQASTSVRSIGNDVAAEMAMPTLDSNSTITDGVNVKTPLVSAPSGGGGGGSDDAFGYEDGFTPQLGTGWTSEGATAAAASARNSSSSAPSSPRIKQGIVSVDPANGRIKRGPISPDATTFNVGDKGSPGSQLQASTISSTAVQSPLQAGFHFAGIDSGSSAAATAAGVAAAAYVANHQRQQKQQGLSSQDSQDGSILSQQQVTSQIVQGDSSSVATPQVTRNPSAASNAVLSADAIAARSQRYFPTSSGQSRQKYADGFRSPATPTSSSSHSGHAYDAFHYQSPNSAKTPTSVPNSANSLLQGSTGQQGMTETQARKPSLGDVMNAQSRYAEVLPQEHRADEVDQNEEGYEEEEEEEEDVWAKVARNTAAAASPPNQTRLTGRNIDSPTSTTQFSDPEISLNRLHEIQNSLVRSASSKKGQSITNDMSQSYDSGTSSVPPPLPVQSTTPFSSTDSTWTRNHQRTPSSTGSGTSGSMSQIKVEKARERARMLAEKQNQQQAQRTTLQEQSPTAAAVVTSPLRLVDGQDTNRENTQRQDVGSQRFPSGAEADLSSGVNNLSSQSPTSSALPAVRMSPIRSPRSTRSQVMYDVTTSHRPTSPPPRSHKASLTNLPSLQDLSMGVTAITLGGESNRNSASLASMVEATTRAHEALTSGNGLASPSLRTPKVIQEDPAEQRASRIEWEELQIEDGFGGYVTEKRPKKQSQFQQIASPMTETDALLSESNSGANVGLASPMTPMSAQFGSQGKDDASPSSWSRLPPGGQEATFNDNLADDVAAQAQAATMALKGNQPSRPQLPARTKSLSRGSKKKLNKTISQPQLVSTTQRLEHAEEVPRVDKTLSKKEGRMHQSYFALQQLQQQQQQQQQKQQQQMYPFLSQQEASASASRINTPTPSLTLNAMRSPSSAAGSSPTETRSAKSGGGHRRRSSSFGHRGQLENEMGGPISTPPSSASLLNTTVPTSPQSDRSGGLGRFMSKLRPKRQGEGAGVIDPYHSGNTSTMKSSPALSAFGTPSTSGSGFSPVFVTPAEDLSTMPTSAKESGTLSGGLPMPSTAGRTPLAGLFGPEAALPPPRSSSVRTVSQVGQGQNVSTLGSPAMIQESWNGGNNRPVANANTFQGDAGSVGRTNNVKSARDTIVRRTIIVSTIESDERRKSNIPTRKPSLRKPVPTEDVLMIKTISGSGSNGLSRDDSTTSYGQTRSSGMSSVRDGSFDHQPISFNGKTDADAAHLVPPSAITSGSRHSHAASDYGTSLYDMYLDDASEAHRTSQIPPLPITTTSTRQSTLDSNGNGARHIEVTERADGSVVWQVIAGLADRSSTYSNSMLGYGHSRATSNDSNFSYLDRSDGLTSPLSSNKGFSTNESLANEDGRSLFARTKGRPRQSFSLDEDVFPPPLPNIRGGDATNKSTAPLEFDMATPVGAAATRIVYTSDADLANMLDSLAGPDKSSAKFEFQRMTKVDGSSTPLSNLNENDNNMKVAAGSDSTNGDSKERIRIEAEIYSLLQRDGHPSKVASSVAKQHAEQVDLNGFSTHTNTITSTNTMSM